MTTTFIGIAKSKNAFGCMRNDLRPCHVILTTSGEGRLFKYTIIFECSFLFYFKKYVSPMVLVMCYHIFFDEQQHFFLNDDDIDPYQQLLGYSVAVGRQCYV